MSILDELLKLNDWLVAKRCAKEEPIDLSQVRLTKEIVLEIAKEFARQKQWLGLAPTEPVLRKEKTGRLLWGVMLLIEGRDEPYLGYSASVAIDDETGKVIDEHLYPR
jgi:hypothetical protein